jgi:hypothetical protein
MLTTYAIKHIPTGFLIGDMRYMSNWEPKKQSLIPKLYATERNAKAVLTQWLAGRHLFNWEYGFEILKQPHRKAEDMEVITIHLLEPKELNHAD